MTERVPDPVLMARLQLSAKGIEWAASLIVPHQHEQLDGEWTPLQHALHLRESERNVFTPRVEATLRQDRPAFEDWDQEAAMAVARHDGDLTATIAEFVAQREQTVELLKAAAPEDWKRTAVWVDGREVDLAWIAYRALAHGLEHFGWFAYAVTRYETHHAPRWGVS